MRSFPYLFALSTLLAGAGACTTTTSLDDQANDDQANIPPIGPETTPNEMATAGSNGPFRDVGIAHASAEQQRRMLEAALGIDLDDAVTTAQALADAAKTGAACPSVTVQADGSTLLTGGCRANGVAFDGTLTISPFFADGKLLSTTYRFADFDLQQPGSHQHFDGTVSLNAPSSIRTLRSTAGLRVMRAMDSADEVTVTSSGDWIATQGHVHSLRMVDLGASPPIVWENKVASDGVGKLGFDLNLDLATQGGSVKFGEISATNAGNGACWTFSTSMPAVCDVPGLVTLDPQ